MTRFLIQITLLLLVALFAWKKGGEPERHVALILIAMLAATVGHAAIVGQWTSYEGIPWGRVAIDFAGFVLILAVALRADRWWPLWIGAVQLQAVLAHLLRAIDADLPPTVYAVMERWPYWIAIVITGLGTFLHVRRQRTASPN